MKVLLVREEQKNRHATAFLLESELDCVVTSCGTPQEALSLLLEEGRPPDLLICEDHENSQKVLKYLLSVDAPTRCIVIKSPQTPQVLAFPDLILGVVDPKELETQLKAVFAQIPRGQAAQKEGDDALYCRVRADLLTEVTPLKQDVFIRLSSTKYVKVFRAGDTFESKDLLKFLSDKKLEHLFIRKADSTSFMASLHASLSKVLEPARDASPKAALQASANLHEAFTDLSGKLGFTPEVQELARTAVRGALQAMTKAPKLAKILQMMLSQKHKYVTAHSVLLSQVSCSLAASQDWFSETSYQKLAHAAFFHDMVFTNQELAHVKDLDELVRRRQEFTDAETALFRNHPLQIAELLKEFTNIPPDVDQIVLQHHEKPDGTGFPRGLSGSQISPLAALFIVAHDITDYLLDHGTDNLDKYLADYRKRVKGNPFRKILEKITVTSLNIGDPNDKSE